MRERGGVQQDEAEAVLGFRRQYHRKRLRPRALRASPIAAACRYRRRSPCRRHKAPAPFPASGRCAASAGSTTCTRFACTVAMPDSVRISRSLRPGLVGKSSRAGLVRSTTLMSWLPGISSMRAARFGWRKMAHEKLRPFRRTAGIGDVARDQDMIERLLGVNFLESRQQPRKPLVAARPDASAFQPKAVTLADDMHIGKMHHAPGPDEAIARPQISTSRAADPSPHPPCPRRRRRPRNSRTGSPPHWRARARQAAAATADRRIRAVQRV